MATFDPKKPYGEVYGHCPYRYEQGGRYFLGNGTECDVEGNVFTAPAPPPPPLPPAASPPVEVRCTATASDRAAHAPRRAPSATFEE